MIIFEIGIVLSFIVNILLIFLPTKQMLKSLEPKKQRNSQRLFKSIRFLMILALVTGMIGGIIELTPLLFSQDEDYSKLVMPTLYCLMTGIAFLRFVRWNNNHK